MSTCFSRLQVVVVAAVRERHDGSAEATGGKLDKPELHQHSDPGTDMS